MLEECVGDLATTLNAVVIPFVSPNMFLTFAHCLGSTNQFMEERWVHGFRRGNV